MLLVPEGEDANNSQVEDPDKMTGSNLFLLSAIQMYVQFL